MKLKQEYIDLIAADLALQGKIAMATQKTVPTVGLWVQPRKGDEINHEKLTMITTLKAICQHTGKETVEELLETAA